MSRRKVTQSKNWEARHNFIIGCQCLLLPRAPWDTVELLSQSSSLSHTHSLTLPPSLSLSLSLSPSLPASICSTLVVTTQAQPAPLLSAQEGCVRSSSTCAPPSNLTTLALASLPPHRSLRSSLRQLEFGK